MDLFLHFQFLRLVEEASGYGNQELIAKTKVEEEAAAEGEKDRKEKETRKRRERETKAKAVAVEKENKVLGDSENDNNKITALLTQLKASKT